MDRSLNNLRRSVAQRIAGVTLAATAASLLITSVTYLVLEGTLAHSVDRLILAVLIPLVVAPLASWRVITLSERLRIANEHLRKLSETDPLTQTLNRRRFFEVFGQHLALAARHGYPTTLLLIDLDHFKQINDRFGHLVGDQVLVESTRLMRAVCRESDVLGRYGGEEFVILLPHTARAGADALAHRIMERVKEMTVDHPVTGQQVPGLAVSISIGGVTSERSDSDLDAMVSRADQLLYSAKQAGRARSVIEALAGGASGTSGAHG
jgi:diguanylate cyclase (GGDEF)-like protein